MFAVSMQFMCVWLWSN